MKKRLLLLSFIKTVICVGTPVVLWHGVGDTCCIKFSMELYKDVIERHSSSHVFSIKIGNSTMQDYNSSYFMDSNLQVQTVCEQLLLIPQLKNGFHAFGFHQGALFFRAVIQRCGHKLPPIKTFISFGGPHQGIYGYVYCGSLVRKSCDLMTTVITKGYYKSQVQDAFTQASYWHDPLNESNYAGTNNFLTDINNVNTINETYVSNLQKLQNFVMVKLEDDQVVQPKESHWFGFYAPGDSKKMLPLQESEIYLKDRLGLKKMAEEKKLVFISRSNHTTAWFLENILPYLLL